MNLYQRTTQRLQQLTHGLPHLMQIRRNNGSFLTEPVTEVHHGRLRFRTLSYLLVPLIMRGLLEQRNYNQYFSRFPTQAELDDVGPHVDWEQLISAIRDIVIHYPMYESYIILTHNHQLYVSAHLQDAVLMALEANHPHLYDALNQWIYARFHQAHSNQPSPPMFNPSHPVSHPPSQRAPLHHPSALSNSGWRINSQTFSAQSPVSSHGASSSWPRPPHAGVLARDRRRPSTIGSQDISIRILFPNQEIRRHVGGILSQPVAHVVNGTLMLRTLSFLLVPLIIRGLVTKSEFNQYFTAFPTQSQLDQVGVHVNWDQLTNVIREIQSVH